MCVCGCVCAHVCWVRRCTKKRKRMVRTGKTAPVDGAKIASLSGTFLVVAFSFPSSFPISAEYKRISDLTFSVGVGGGQ